jgi:hypothetical protein
MIFLLLGLCLIRAGSAESREKGKTRHETDGENGNPVHGRKVCRANPTPVI